MSLSDVEQQSSAPARTKPARWRDIRAAVRRWFERARELVRLRISMGMMAEARQADAAEYAAAMGTARALMDKLAALELERRQWRADKRAADYRADNLYIALHELVHLKQIKRMMEGGTATPADAARYENTKEAVWLRAEDNLSNFRTK